MRRRGLKRIEVVVRSQDADLVRNIAATLRRDDPSARQLRKTVRGVITSKARPSIADVVRSLPDLSGPEFDQIFDDIVQLRQHPIMKRCATSSCEFPRRH